MIAAYPAQRIAVRAGLLGGILGILAGLTQIVAGRRIPAWSGAKDNPTGLGLLTMLLAAVAVLSALALRRSTPLSPRRRALSAAGLIVPAALCFSTVGRLWYAPGLLLLAGTAATVAAGSAGELARVIRQEWTPILLSVLGAFEILMAISAGPFLVITVGTIGGLALAAVPWLTTRSRGAALVLLALGTVPFAVLTWWSLASPLLAVLALAAGLTLMRPQVRSRRRTAAHVQP